jgi:hypothetical protein
MIEKSVIFKDFITRHDLRENPRTLYVFGDNEARIGMGGQAGACRGEHNAIGIATKRRPSMDESAFWSDDDYERCIAIIDRDMKPLFEHLKKGGVVVMLPKRAPRIMQHIRNKIMELQRQV